MKSKIWLYSYTAVLLLIFILAYIGLIPTNIKEVPFYDSIGHLMLYGTWGYLSGKVKSKSVVSIRGFKIVSGVFIVFIIAVLEEHLQSFSPIRTFSLYDLGWGVLGLLIASVVLNFEKNNASNVNK